ncbi:NLE domain-containing protein [Ditylenchus destructor]|nr:NLE domain-containing protein [Ditylenchus destructor]
MVEDSSQAPVGTTSFLHVSFYSEDKRLSPNLPAHSFDVPTSSVADQLNLLVNKAAQSENDEWEDVELDFLIKAQLLRTSLLEFVDTNGLSTESVIQIECVLREPAPSPDKDLQDSEWVADLQVTGENLLFSVNYGGELSVWNLNKGKKLLTMKIDDGPIKCLDLMEISSEKHIVVGAQNQTLTLLSISASTSKSSKSPIIELTPRMIFRGHERSVECVAAKKDGTRVVSGSFDQCLKVWNTEKGDDENAYAPSNETSTKKAKITTLTKTPMVTLEAHREAITGVKWNQENEKEVVTVSWDHSIIVWDLELAGPVTTLNSNKSFTSLSLKSSSSVAITGSADPIIRLWDFRSKDVTWAPDVDHLFASASFDNSVKMWDIRSPKAPLYEMIGHEDRALTVDWSNKSVIASGAADKTIKTFRRN